MNISNNNKRAYGLLQACLLLFLLMPAKVNAQTISLEKLNQYSFLTGQHVVSSIIPDQKIYFINGTDKIYFNLTVVESGFSTSVRFGKIENEAATVIDTADHPGFPDQLRDFFYDQDENIHSSITNSWGGYIRKIDPDGNLLWEEVYFGGGTNYPAYHFLSEDNHPMVVNFRRTDDSTQLILQKFNNQNGTLLWESENISTTNQFFSPIIAKEYEDFFQIFSYNSQQINLAKIDKDGNLLSSVLKSNPENDVIYRHVNMDNNKNTYTGLAAWGYRFPKLDENLDTAWMYEKLSPFGDETLNRSTNISIDEEGNVYVGGPFRLDSISSSSFLLTKLNDQGDLVWQNSYGSGSIDTAYFTNYSFIHNNRIWCTIGTWQDSIQVQTGELVCYNLNGELLLNKKFEEFTPYGVTGWLDFYEDQLIVSGSSSPNGLSDSVYQHIIHYRIDTITSTVNNLPSSIQINPYPNPTSGWISLFEAASRNIEAFSLQDLSGRQMPIPTDLIGSGRVNLSALPNGIYLVRYRIDEQWYMGKVVKQ